MTYMGAYEAKTFFPKLLQKVIQGETVTITKHGKPIAEIIPVAKEHKIAQSTIDRKEIFRQMIELSDSIGPTHIPIKELREEGRRF